MDGRRTSSQSSGDASLKWKFDKTERNDKTVDYLQLPTFMKVKVWLKKKSRWMTSQSLHCLSNCQIVRIEVSFNSSSPGDCCSSIQSTGNWVFLFTTKLFGIFQRKNKWWCQPYSPFPLQHKQSGKLRNLLRTKKLNTVRNKCNSIIKSGMVTWNNLNIVALQSNGCFCGLD